MDVLAWSEKEVGEWLTQQGFQHLIPAFQRSWVDGQTLLEITEDDLVTTVGVTPALAKAVLAAIDELRECLAPASIAVALEKLRALQATLRATNSDLRSRLQTVTQELRAFRILHLKGDDAEGERGDTARPSSAEDDSSPKEKSSVGKSPNHWFRMLTNQSNDSSIIGDHASVKQLAAMDSAIKRVKRKSRIIFPEDLGQHEYTRPDADLLATKFNSISSSNRFVLKPEHPHRLKWDLFMTLLVLYYGVSVPLALAFSEVNLDVTAMVVVENLFNACFLIDIVLNFFTAYRPTEGPHKGVLETRLRETCRHYFTGWFALDLAASVPVDWFMPSTDAGGVVKVNKLLRLLRGFKVMRILRVSRIMSRIEQVTSTDPSVLRLMKLVLALCFMWHWVAALYWYISEMEGLGSSQWTPAVGMADVGLAKKYSHAFFWAVMSSTGVGVSIMPEKPLEVAFSIFTITLGVLTYALIVGSATTALANIDQSDAIRRQHLGSIAAYLRAREAPRPLQQRVMAYYEYIYTSYHDVDTKQMLADLHPRLRLQLDIAINSRTIKRVPLFRGCSLDCQLELIERLTPRVYLPSEFVVLLGERGKEMFFLIRGRCEVLDKDNVRRRILKDGEFFGEMAVYNNVRRTMTIRTTTHTEMMVLHKTDFRYLMKKFPVLAVSMFHNATHLTFNLRGWELVRYLVSLIIMCRTLNGTTTFHELVYYMSTPALGSRKANHVGSSFFEDVRVLGRRVLTKLSWAQPSHARVLPDTSAPAAAPSTCTPTEPAPQPHSQPLRATSSLLPPGLPGPATTETTRRPSSNASRDLAKLQRMFSQRNNV